MKWKTRLTMPLLFTLIVLSQSLTTQLSATALPHIRITPSSIINTGLTPTNNFTISIETNYTGNDIWGWELTLTYNPLVLEGHEVVDGNLNASMRFEAGTFDNNAGELSLTGGYFNVTPGEHVNVTSGPGILANVTFKVVGTGDTPITLGTETKLIGHDGTKTYEIVDANEDIFQIGHGYFRNTAYYVVHDVAVLSGAINETMLYDDTSLYRARTANISATVKNKGNVTERLTVSIYWHFISDDWLVYNKSVTLNSNATDSINVAWNTSDFNEGIGNLTVVVSEVWNETETADNEYVIDEVRVRIQGDVDGDGDVDDADYMLFIGVYPDRDPPPTDPEADIDGDGKIDAPDWVLLTGNRGRSVY